MKKTDNYSLPQWEKQDFIKMEDFNDLTQKTDAALKANADATATGLNAEIAARGEAVAAEAENRSAALAAGAAAHADWTIAAQLNGDFTQAKAYEETLAYLQSNPAPDVVYCENDNMCFGVMQALDELGIAIKETEEATEE